MAVNKVVYNTANGERVLMDLTTDTVTPETLAEGATAHDATGRGITGTMATDVVRYGAQSLTDAQKSQARTNIGAASEAEVSELSEAIAEQQAEIDGKQPKGNYALKSEIPTSLPASDVSAWAKASTKPSYTASEVGARPSTWTPSASDVGAMPSSTVFSLGMHTDGLVYLFKDGVPVGTGIELPEGGGLYGYVDSDNNIILRGDYPEGTFVKYEMADGSIIDIGEMVFEKKPEYAKFTNLFNPSTATLNNRINSSGGLTAADGLVTTDFISVAGKVPFSESTKIYVKGATFAKSSYETNWRAGINTWVNKPSTGYSGRYSNIIGSQFTPVDEGNGVISISGNAVASAFASNVTFMALMLHVKNTAITADDIKDIIVTIDEPIYK